MQYILYMLFYCNCNAPTPQPANDFSTESNLPQNIQQKREKEINPLHKFKSIIFLIIKHVFFFPYNQRAYIFDLIIWY